MRLKELIPFMKAYVYMRQQCDDDYQKTKKYLADNYNQNTALFQQVLDKAKRKNEADIEKAMSMAMKKVNEAFSDVNQAMDDCVVAPMSQEQCTILGVLDKLKDASISDEEAELYYRQLKTNYSAKRIGYPMLTKVTGRPQVFVSYDIVKDTVDQIEKKTRNWVENYNPISYDHFEFLETFEQALLDADAEVEAFLKGDA